MSPFDLNELYSQSRGNEILGRSKRLALSDNIYTCLLQDMCHWQGRPLYTLQVSCDTLQEGWLK